MPPHPYIALQVVCVVPSTGGDKGENTATLVVLQVVFVDPSAGGDKGENAATLVLSPSGSGGVPDGPRPPGHE